MQTKNDDQLESSRSLQIAIIICAIVEAVVMAVFMYSKLKH
jgi:hypothetical protein